MRNFPLSTALAVQAARTLNTTLLATIQGSFAFKYNAGTGKQVIMEACGAQPVLFINRE